jgi:hypothetical protein
VQEIEALFPENFSSEVTSSFRTKNALFKSEKVYLETRE